MLDGETAREYARLAVRLGLSADTSPTQIDGRYRLQRTLGRGAMGVVHEAWDERLERKVALKLVRAQPGVDLEELQTRLEDEARSLARVDHPNIVGLHDIGRYEGQAYLSMQFVEGTTLRRWQVDREPTTAEILDVYIQAGHGLVAAHAEGVVHRDFKPDNVLVGEDGIVRVADFGIAAAIAERATMESSDVGLAVVGTDQERTHTAFSGTVPYAAPEQVRGAPVNARCDQFGFCVALWEAIVGTRPFEARTLSEYDAALDRELPSGAGLPRWLVPILRRGLATNPAERFGAMDALVRALQRGRGRRRRRVLGAVVAVGLGAAAATGWAVSSASQRAALQSCDEFIAQVQEVWNDERGQSLHSEYSVRTLDELAGAWSGSAAALCQADVAPRSDDEDRRCHEAWLSGLGRTARLLERGDPITLARAPDLLDRLRPPQGDYCALAPAPAVDPEVWSLAESSREAAIVGDLEGAQAYADEALTRAAGLDDGPWSAHRAEAYAAQAQVHARSGQFAAASERLKEAEAHAIGASYPRRLLWVRLLWAKVLALSEEPGSGERAAEHLHRARPLAPAVGPSSAAFIEAELAEAGGMVERARGEHRAAIELHRSAERRFATLGRPLLQARALLGAGASHQWLDELDQAASAYAQAEAIFVQAQVPPQYRNRVKVHLNLGTLALMRGADEGFEHLEYVAEHGTEPERMQAVAYGIALAQSRLGDDAQGRADAKAWAQRGIAELGENPDVSVRTAHDIQLAAGTVLAQLDDPRGEPLMRAALALAPELPDDVAAMAEQTWVDRLWATGRCGEAREHLTALDARIQEDSLSLPGWESWRSYFESTPCSAEQIP